jgi:hypothetical protein
MVRPAAALLLCGAFASALGAQTGPAPSRPGPRARSAPTWTLSGSLGYAHAAAVDGVSLDFGLEHRIGDVQLGARSDLTMRTSPAHDYRYYFATLPDGRVYCRDPNSTQPADDALCNWKGLRTNHGLTVSAVYLPRCETTPLFFGAGYRFLDANTPVAILGLRLVHRSTNVTWFVRAVGGSGYAQVSLGGMVPLNHFSSAPGQRRCAV